MGTESYSAHHLPMSRISRREFERLPLRVHGFLNDVSLHDVWATDLPRAYPGITLDEFLGTASKHGCTSPLVRLLLSIRLFVGRLFGLDREPDGNAWESFAARLTGGLAHLWHEPTTRMAAPPNAVFVGWGART